jgi:hypothetical protein
VYIPALKEHNQATIDQHKSNETSKIKMSNNTESQVYELPKLVLEAKFTNENDSSLSKTFHLKNTTSQTISTYAHTNGISDYLKQKIPGLGENIDDDHDKPSDVKKDESGNISEYSVLRAQLTDIQDQVNIYLTELMTNKK